MNNLVIDLTHGGVKIAVSLAKKGKSVIAYDLYKTLKPVDAKMLEVYNVGLIELEDLKNFRGEVNVIYPIHMPLDFSDITRHNPDIRYTFQTHHEAVGELLKDWGDDILKIEVTGVKGKTTSVFMLKEILIDDDPLILSSLGSLLFENGRKYILKRDISITPANIKETVDLAYKVANPICKIADGVVESENLRKYNSAIFESSLGASGIGDVGLLTNIAENYPIASNKKSASEAKKQIFRCGCVCIEKEAYDKYYSDVEHDCTNTFSLKDSEANLYLKDAEYSLDRTEISIHYSDVKTVTGEVISGDIILNAFAPGKHHVSNILGVVLTCLSANIEKKRIIDGIERYNGIMGRTNRKEIENSTVIEEINPGLNTEAIKQSVEMIANPDDYLISVGGDYGITCEEIDEERLCDFLKTLDREILLTGDLGASIASKLKENYRLFENYDDVYDLAVSNSKNLLFIYRSDYRRLSLR